MNAYERLERLLEDDRTRLAAARIGQSWRESGDDERLIEELDAIEKHLAEMLEAVETAKRDQAEAEAKRQALKDDANERVKALVDMRVPSEVLSDLLADVEAERYEQAFQRADEIQETLQKIRAGELGMKMIWRGTWDSEVEYEPGDTVREEGLAFVCLVRTLDHPSVDQMRPWMPLMDPRRLAAFVPVAGGGGSGGGVGPPGPAGPQNLFVQETAPVTSESTYLWVQTGIGANDDLTFWVEDAL